jgi:hypothetical protein
MAEIRVELQRTKDTKNMTRFDFAGAATEPPIRTLYVRQEELEELGAPASIVVTVAAADAA